jgi:hypothetical protein
MYLLLSLFLGCKIGDKAPASTEGQLEESCAGNTDCAEGLVCEELKALGYWGGYDSSGAMESICTKSCTKAEDCPSLSLDPCGEMPITCDEGYCRSLSICEG